MNTLSPESLRLIVFFALLSSFAIFEAVLPAKTRTQPRQKRWITNVIMVMVDSVVVRLMGPFIAAAVAIYAASQGWGLFNIVDWPIWAELVLALIILDLMIYLQHVISHLVPVFWRFHKVHHADRDIDVTTALRFHPVEIALSMLYKGVIILVLGPSVFAVLLFEIILNGMAMFNHANWRLPKWLDNGLRAFIVTPDMHRVHHSVDRVETNRNFGFNLSVWDRIFRTYQAQPKDGHDNMIIGLPEYQSGAPSSLIWSLMLPFKR